MLMYTKSVIFILIYGLGSVIPILQLVIELIIWCTHIKVRSRTEQIRQGPASLVWV